MVTGLWMRIDPSIAFDNMNQNGIKGTTDWTGMRSHQYEAENRSDSCWRLISRKGQNVVRSIRSNR
jgi:hypothetical protein